MNSVQNLISIQEAATIMGWPYHRTLTWVKRGKIPTGQKVGWGWVVERSSVARVHKQVQKKKKKA